MVNIAEIRLNNINVIRQVLADGREYTARSMAESTGLSIATCTGILKELAEQSELLTDVRQTNDVGRKTVFFKINPEFSRILHIICFRNAQVCRLFICTRYLFGEICVSFTEDVPDHSADTLNRVIDRLLGQDESILSVVVACYRQTDLFPLQDGLRAKVPLYIQSFSNFLSLSYYEQLHIGIMTCVVCLKDSPAYIFHSYCGHVTSDAEMPTEELKTVLPGFMRIFHPGKILLFGNEALCHSLSKELEPSVSIIKTENIDLLFDCMASWIRKVYCGGIRLPKDF